MRDAGVLGSTQAPVARSALPTTSFPRNTHCPTDHGAAAARADLHPATQSVSPAPLSLGAPQHRRVRSSRLQAISSGSPLCGQSSRAPPSRQARHPEVVEPVVGGAQNQPTCRGLRKNTERSLSHRGLPMPPGTDLPIGCARLDAIRTSVKPRGSPLVFASWDFTARWRRSRLFLGSPLSA